MKRAYKILIITLIMGTLTSAVAHKFYVAVFQMEYLQHKKQVQVTGRVFIDDLEKGLENRFGKKIYLGTAKEDENATEYIRQYFSDKMSVKINGTSQKVKYIARVAEDDVEVLYFKVLAPEAVKTIEVENTLLFELFSEQQNITHIKNGDERKSLLLTPGTPLGKVEF